MVVRSKQPTPTFDLERFSLREMTLASEAMATLAHGATSQEEVAQRLVLFLRESLRASAADAPACALVRMFVTQPFGSLPPSLRAVAARGAAPGPRRHSKCLVLLGSAGEEERWNAPRASRAHRVVRLDSPESVRARPMLDGLLAQFGVDVRVDLSPQPAMMLEGAERTFNVFHVLDAQGSPLVPDQEGFVRPSGIRSVLGFAGTLPRGDIFIVILFCKVTVTRDVAELFAPLALRAKLALLPLDRQVFRTPRRAAPRRRTAGPSPDEREVLQGWSRETAEKLLQVYQRAVLAQAAQLEGAVESAESRFTVMMQSSIDPIVVADAAGRIVYANGAAEACFGYGGGELPGKPVEALVPERQRAAHRDGLRRFATLGERRLPQLGVEVVGLRRDGAEVPLEITLSSWLVGRERFFGAILRDITERRRVDAVVKEQEARLAVAQRTEAVGRLAAGVAHDFNNLLTVIGGSASFIRSALPPADRLRAHAEAVLTASERAGRVVRQLLDYSRARGESQQLVVVGGVVQEVAGSLRRVIGAGVSLATQIDAEGARALVDPVMLEQLVMNLVLNARDALPEGGSIDVATRPVRLEGAAAERAAVKPGEYVLLSVRDNGVGMDAGTRDRMFEPFFTTKRTGTGLGLSIVQGIVRQIGGAIDVESVEGTGTSIHVYVPRADEPEARVAADARPLQAELDGTETVLVVDDDPQVLDVVRHALREKGYRVLAASGPGDALLIAERFRDPIHLLVADVALPYMDGAELERRIRASRPDIAALLMTGLEIAPASGQAAAPPRRLYKPFSTAELLAAVRHALHPAPARHRADP